MSDKRNRLQHHVGSLGYTSKKSALSVKTVIEITEKGQANAIGWISLNCFADKKTITMLQDTNSIRAFSLAIRELVKRGSTAFGDHTDPNLAGGTGGRKQLRLKANESGFFVNMTEGDEKRCSYTFDIYEMLAFADQLKVLCEETEKALFWRQRELADAARMQPH